MRVPGRGDCSISPNIQVETLELDMKPWCLQVLPVDISKVIPRSFQMLDAQVSILISL
jgi:hypothetical protein